MQQLLQFAGIPHPDQQIQVRLGMKKFLSGQILPGQTPENLGIDRQKLFADRTSFGQHIQAILQARQSKTFLHGFLADAKGDAPQPAGDWQRYAAMDTVCSRSRAAHNHRESGSKPIPDIGSVCFLTENFRTVP